MILKDPLKGGEIQEVKPLIANKYPRVIKPCLCITDPNGEKYYLSWENLHKILKSIDFDIDQKRIRKHLIPLTNEVPVQP